MHRAAVLLDAPDLINRLVRGLEQRFQGGGSQGANHEEITVVVAQIQRGQVRIVLERLAEGFEQCQALFQVRRLRRRVEHQQAQQMANGLIGGVQVQPDILLDALEELLTAGQNDLRGLPIVENAQHHASQQQQEGEHHADMDVQGKPSLIRAQWAGHCGVSP
ncbi:hypothetical protein D3C84_527870 [compost metagenome]